MKSMSFLEWLAWLGVLSLILSVAVAWDSQSNFAAAAKRQAALLGWFILGIAKKPIGWTLGVATLAALLVAPHNDTLVTYHRRRVWVPCH